MFLQVFDPKQEFCIVERKLPHWSQAGTVCFITWRTADSIPQSVLNRWHADRDTWLRKHGIKPANSNWRRQVRELSPELKSEFVKTFSRRWHRFLDSGMGECVLRLPEVSLIVADALKKFDGDKYELTDFVVMPNHVHLIAAFPDEAGMLTQCEDWKHYTARTINRKLGKSGTFWQQDGFDHLIRTEDYFQTFRKYIACNGTKAGLASGEFRHYSKPLGGGKS